MINRRQFIASGVGFITGSAVAATFPSQNANEDGHVVFAGFGGALEQVFRERIIPPFQKETGIPVTYVAGTALSNFAKLNAARAQSGIDIYWSNGLTHVAGKQLQLYDKLDPTIVTNLRDLLPIALDRDNIGAASYVIATALEYNTEAYANAGIPTPTSWNDMWDPRLKGKVALLSFDVAATQDLLVILTKLAGGTEQDIRPGLKRIRSLRSAGNLVRFASTPAEIDNMIVQQQAWLTVASTPRALILRQRGAPVNAAFPKEGVGFFTNYLDVIHGTPRPRAAQSFINYILGSSAQTILANDALAASVRKDVPLPKPLQGRMPSLDPAAHGFIQIDRKIMNRDLDRWATMWNRELNTF